MNVNEIVNGVINVEKGYWNDPVGGPTMYGITEPPARAAGYKGDMKDLPRETAYAIYYDQYVTAPGFNKIITYSDLVAQEVIDTGVNMGVGVAGKFLQRSLNALEKSGLIVDGKVGQRTINALRDYYAHRGSDGTKVLLKMLNSLQATRYIELAESSEARRKNLYGWIRLRVEI